MHILICEDTPEVANMLHLILEHAGAESTIVKNDFERLLTPGAWDDVDVALVDLMLGGVDGEDIVRYVAENHPNVRRFVLSAIGHQREGLDDIATVISKPFDPRILLNALGLRDV